MEVIPRGHPPRPEILSSTALNSSPWLSAVEGTCLRRRWEGAPAGVSGGAWGTRRWRARPRTMTGRWTTTSTPILTTGLNSREAGQVTPRLPDPSPADWARSPSPRNHPRLTDSGRPLGSHSPGPLPEPAGSTRQEPSALPHRSGHPTGRCTDRVPVSPRPAPAQVVPPCRRDPH